MDPALASRRWQRARCGTAAIPRWQVADSFTAEERALLAYTDYLVDQ